MKERRAQTVAGKRTEDKGEDGEDLGKSIASEEGERLWDVEIV